MNDASIKIMWLGQAGFILECAEGCIAIDPFCGEAQDGMRRLYPPVIAQGGTVDLAISTHAHWDHFDPFTYIHYVQPRAIAGPHSCMAALCKSELHGRVEAIPFGVGDTLKRAGFLLRAVYADHDEDSIGVVAERGGLRLYFSGDTLFSSLLMVRNIDIKPDVAFICINGKFLNMDCTDAALYCRFLQTKYAVPTHYDLIEHNTEDPRQFTEKLAALAPGVKGIMLERGQMYTLDDLLY